MKILLTGTAGFIGFSLTQRLLENHHQVVGIDNLNSYYDVQLKRDRLTQLRPHPSFTFKEMDVANRIDIEKLFQQEAFDVVIHLAAQAGVRYSIESPEKYIDSNLVGFGNILEGCRHQKIKNLLFASSSSVYGTNASMPFSEHHSTEHPISLYAATKKANELMAHSYAHLYQLPCTGLRFFTVYGPWGRPDMALFKFTKNIIQEQAIDVYNYGQMKRDFTYIDDVTDAILALLDKPAQSNAQFNAHQPDPATSHAPYRIYNIGHSKPALLIDFIEAIEHAVGKKAIQHHLPLQPGDVLATYANVEDLSHNIGFEPKISIQEGVTRFVSWYRDYYKI